MVYETLNLREYCLTINEFMCLPRCWNCWKQTMVKGWQPERRNLLFRPLWNLETKTIFTNKRDSRLHSKTAPIGVYVHFHVYIPSSMEQVLVTAKKQWQRQRGCGGISPNIFLAPPPPNNYKLKLNQVWLFQPKKCQNSKILLASRTFFH